MLMAQGTNMTPRHTKVLVALLVAALAAALISLSQGSLVGALLSGGVGVVLLFVMGNAWTRYSGEPTEHHARSDKFLDDTAP